MHTVPNQKVIIVHTEKCERDFIQIKKENLANAFKLLDGSYAAIYLYICLAGNAEGYKFAFSPKAIGNQFGMPETTARDQLKKLEKCGFLVQKHEGSNQYDFYQTPHAQTPKAEVEEAETREFRF